jgi:hypothetical protein
MSNDTIVVEGPEGMAYARKVTIVHGLALEINTGMKMSRGISCLKVAQMDGHTVKRTKRGALLDMIEVMKKDYPDWVPSEPVTRALAK